MKKMLLFILTLLLIFSTQFVTAHEANDIEISGVWARPTTTMSMEESDMDTEMMEGETSAIYMTINNSGSHSVRLVSAATSVANIAEIHETRMGENDVMQMRPVGGGIEIAAGESAELRPGSFHIMLLDLNEPLMPADAFMIDLAFEMDNEGEPVTVAVAVPILEEPPLMGDIVVTQAWARPTALAAEMGDTEMGGTSAAYMLIENKGSEDVTLIGGLTSMAGIVEIHETRMTDQGVMQMRPVGDGIVIPAGERVELRPGGFHVMMMDLQEPFVQGDALFLELTFDNGETIGIAAPIEDQLGMMGMDE